jgi:hypothetical protein
MHLRQLATCFGLLILLAACGETSNAAQVHADWLQALRDNNRAHALALFADIDGRDNEVQLLLNRIESELHRPVGTFGQGGPLISMQPFKLEDRGAGKRGWSRWQFAREAECYTTDLAQTPKGWRVVDFNQTTKACAP